VAVVAVNLLVLVEMVVQVVVVMEGLLLQTQVGQALWVKETTVALALQGMMRVAVVAVLVQLVLLV